MAFRFARHLVWAAALSAAAQVPGPTPAAVPERLAPEDLEVPSYDQLARRAQQHRREGRLPEAMQDWIEMARRRPEGGLGHYNLACAFALLGRAGQCARFLEAAWKHGFRDLELLEGDPDLDPVRDQPAFRETLSKLRAEARREAAAPPAGRVLQVPAHAWLPVRVVEPKLASAGKALPLVVALHGAGDTSLGFLPFGQALAARGFLVCLVEGQYPVREGPDPGGAVHFLMQPGGGRKPDERTLRGAEDHVLAAVEAVRKQYAIEPGKVFLVGFSQGGRLACSLGLRYGDRFRGVVPIGAGLVEKPPEKPSVSASWLLCHSPADALVGEAEHRKAVEALAGLGIRAEVERYPGGHAITPALVARIAAWMQRLVD